MIQDLPIITPSIARIAFFLLGLITAISLIPKKPGWNKLWRRGADFSAEQRSNVFAKLDKLSPEARRALCRVIKAEIEPHQLNVDTRIEFERAGIMKPTVSYEIPDLIERYRPLIEQWCKKQK